MQDKKDFMNGRKARVIAFYLPQFHPVKENDEWWGKGFTEWTNVAKASPLFRGHYQPRIPADLGFYDLRLPDVREAQAELAREAGVDGFCYWHYWLGGGRQLLERPLQEVVASGKPDFPFCLGWANHSWLKKLWNPDVSRFSQEMLIEQTYSKDDIDLHFNTMLPMFRDKRYMQIDGRLLFLIYAPLAVPDLRAFIARWRELAKVNNLPDFYFIGQAKKEELNNEKLAVLDAINFECIYDFFRQSRLRKLWAYIFRHPIITQYKDILKIYDLSVLKGGNVIPSIYPSWDLTPRRGMIGTVFHKSTPELFAEHVQQIMEATHPIDGGEKILFLKSWNEWAEGNYMEPDLKFGKGYINALHDVIYGSR